MARKRERSLKEEEPSLYQRRTKNESLCIYIVDTLSELRYAEKAGTPKSFAQNDLHIDLQKLKKGDYMLQCFAAFVNLGDKTPGADPLVTALEEIDVFKRIMKKYPEDIAPVYRPSDIRKNAAEGKISGMLTIEEAAAARAASACCAGCTSWASA